MEYSQTVNKAAQMARCKRDGGFFIDPLLTRSPLIETIIGLLDVVLKKSGRGFNSIG